MRRARALLLGLLAGLLVGCAAGQPVRTTSAWLERWSPFPVPSGPDVVMMEVVLLERPIGDPYINGELWSLADEQVVPLERKAVLEDNGLRVGQIAGITPARLQRLLTSESSCANPRRIQMRSGTPRTLTIGPKTPTCRFETRLDGHAVPATLEQAECTLTVVPTPSADGRVRLRFTPEVRHGEITVKLQPTADESGLKQWAWREQQPTENYAGLSWEVLASPNEYVVVGRVGIGLTASATGFSFARRKALPVQRLLVIRTASTASAKSIDTFETAADEEPIFRAPPLAVQAAWTRPSIE